MLPEYPKLKVLELEDTKSIAKYFKEAPSICEFALANLLIWQDFDHPQITMINDNLCILISPPNEPSFFLEPVGKHQLAETIELCLKHTGKISRANESFIAKLPKDKYQIHELRSQFDYVYEVKTLAELKGKKFDGKRNHLKRFRRHFLDYEYISLTPELKHQAIKLFNIWFEMRKTSRYFPKLAHDSQKKAIEKAFVNFKELNLIGGAVLVEKELVGFILGSKLNEETISVHFQYGHPAFTGIFQTLLWEACNKSFKNFKYINLEQDLGIPGLRKSKLSYYPNKLEKKFEIAAIQK